MNKTSHELKTPLIPIKAQVQLLLAGDYGALNEEQKEATEMIYKNENRLEQLVTDVLSVAKLESKKLNLVLEKTKLDRIIIEAVKNFKEFAEGKKIELIIKTLPELPELFIDARRVSQVISNLINNTIKFTPDNGKIEISAHQEENNIIVSVRDNGIGMNERTMGKLFTPFFQAERGLSRKYGGTGLGLSICKGIVEAHGGKIWAESDGVGKGSIFRFSLPIKWK